MRAALCACSLCTSENTGSGDLLLLLGRKGSSEHVSENSAVSAFPYIAFTFTAFGVSLPITSLYVLCFQLLGNCSFSDIFFFLVGH